MNESYLYIFYGWTVLMLLQLVAVPLVAGSLGKKLADGGWALGRITTWLLVSLIVWFLGHIGFPVNTGVGVFGILGVFTLFNLVILRRHKDSIVATLQRSKAFIITEELLLLLGFAGLTVMRSLKPEILDLEKFMDVGFMATYLRSPTLPAPDMWLAGSSINYYSFGHFMGSIMTRLWGLRLEYSYNLLLAMSMGLCFAMSFSVVVNLLHHLQFQAKQRSLIYGGLIGSFLVTFGGNMHTFWYWVTNQSWDGYWYASATRFIDRTIHEFPSYSFVVSDIHAHVWGLPLVFAFLTLTSVWLMTVTGFGLPKKKTKDTYFALIKKSLGNMWRSGMVPLAVVLGGLMGVMAMTNAWDLAIYGLLLLVIGVVVVLSRPVSFIPLLVSAIVMGVTAIFIAAPFMLTFESISEGVAVATEHSPVWQLVALWTGHILLSLLALIAAIKGWWQPGVREETKTVYRYVTAVTLTAWLLLLLPELVFVKDIYSGHPRANTMFKLTYQAFILMSLLGGWVAGFVFIKPKTHVLAKVSISLLVLFITVAALLFPYFGQRDYFGFNWLKPLESLKKQQSLDGYAWLREQSPDDYEAIMWLRRNIEGQPVILEAVGESYTTFNRASAYTGIPSVLGWRVHEWLWRGGFDIPGQRTEEVRLMYESPLSEMSQEHFDTYDVAYIFVGEKENETYTVHPQIRDLGKVVFEQGGTYIVRIEKTNK